MSPARSRLPYAATLVALAVAAGCGSPAAPSGASPATPGAAVTRTVTITGSRVDPAPSQVELAAGDRLVLVVTSDHDDELHAHGFDVSAALKAGVAATVTLSGATPGVYDVETHEPALTLLTVAVR
ncbi:MAG TPA: hypothetical protein VFJ94_15890 [Intrasporangium sp.]|uniref:hypothetical protein n=1 Tax=Intrasporangium sp. TaxID=1925024 RepID=UPI002D784885|nr:hypothetical protein [Intrasporangium sp.]HET7399997.1 hypothetical protein [Intrasporangium sp.]